jgi:hypothetical protein
MFVSSSLFSSHWLLMSPKHTRHVVSISKPLPLLVLLPWVLFLQRMPLHFLQVLVQIPLSLWDLPGLCFKFYIPRYTVSHCPFHFIVLHTIDHPKKLLNLLLNYIYFVLLYPTSPHPLEHDLHRGRDFCLFCSFLQLDYLELIENPQ